MTLTERVQRIMWGRTSAESRAMAADEDAARDERMAGYKTHLFGSFHEGDEYQVLRITGWGPFRKARPVPVGFPLKVRDAHDGWPLRKVRVGKGGMWQARYQTDLIEVSGDGRNWTRVRPAFER